MDTVTYRGTVIPRGGGRLRYHLRFPAVPPDSLSDFYIRFADAMRQGMEQDEETGDGILSLSCRLPDGGPSRTDSLSAYLFYAPIFDLQRYRDGRLIALRRFSPCFKLRESGEAVLMPPPSLPKKDKPAILSALGGMPEGFFPEGNRLCLYRVTETPENHAPRIAEYTFTDFFA